MPKSNLKIRSPKDIKTKTPKDLRIKTPQGLSTTVNLNPMVVLKHLPLAVGKDMLVGNKKSADKTVVEKKKLVKVKDATTRMGTTSVSSSPDNPCSPKWWGQVKVEDLYSYLQMQPPADFDFDTLEQFKSDPGEEEDPVVTSTVTVLATEFQGEQIMRAMSHNKRVRDGKESVSINTPIIFEIAEKLDMAVPEKFLLESINFYDYSAPFVLNVPRLCEEFLYRQVTKQLKGQAEDPLLQPSSSAGSGRTGLSPLLKLSKLMEQGKIDSPQNSDEVFRSFTNNTKLIDVEVNVNGKRKLVQAYKDGNNVLLPCKGKDCNQNHYKQHGTVLEAPSCSGHSDARPLLQAQRRLTPDSTSPHITNVTSLAPNPAAPGTRLIPLASQVPSPLYRNSKSVLANSVTLPLVLNSTPAPVGAPGLSTLLDKPVTPAPSQPSRRKVDRPPPATQPMPIILVPPNNANKRKTDPMSQATDHAVCSYIPILPKGQQRVMTQTPTSQASASSLVNVSGGLSANKQYYAVLTSKTPPPRVEPAAPPAEPTVTPVQNMFRKAPSTPPRAATPTKAPEPAKTASMSTPTKAPEPAKTASMSTPTKAPEPAKTASMSTPTKAPEPAKTGSTPTPTKTPEPAETTSTQTNAPEPVIAKPVVVSYGILIPKTENEDPPVQNQSSELGMDNMEMETESNEGEDQTIRMSQNIFEPTADGDSEMSFEDSETVPVIMSTSGGVAETFPLIMSTSGGFAETFPLIMSTSGGVAETVPLIMSTSGGVAETFPLIMSTSGGVAERFPLIMSTSGGVAETVPLVMSTSVGVTEIVPLIMSTSEEVAETVPMIMSSSGGVPETVPLIMSPSGGTSNKPSFEESKLGKAQKQHQLLLTMTSATIAEKVKFPTQKRIAGSDFQSCRFCGKSFPVTCETMYRNHMLTKHAVEIDANGVQISKVPGTGESEWYKCKTCDQLMAFDNRESHRKACSPDVPEDEAFSVIQVASADASKTASLQCGLCDKTFETRIGLRQHLNGFHKDVGQKVILDPTMRCSFCLQKFEDSAQLTLHCSACTSRRASEETMLELAKGMMDCEICSRPHKNIQETHDCYTKTGLIRCLLCHHTVVSRGNFFHHMKAYHFRSAMGIICPFCDIGEVPIRECFIHIMDRHFNRILEQHGLIVRTGRARGAFPMIAAPGSVPNRLKVIAEGPITGSAGAQAAKPVPSTSQTGTPVPVAGTTKTGTPVPVGSTTQAGTRGPVAGTAQTRALQPVGGTAQTRTQQPVGGSTQAGTRGPVAGTAQTRAPQLVGGTTQTTTPQPVRGTTQTGTLGPVAIKTQTGTPSPIAIKTQTGTPGPITSSTQGATPRPVAGGTQTVTPRPITSSTQGAAPRPVAGGIQTVTPGPVAGGTQTVTPGLVTSLSQTITARPVVGTSQARSFGGLNTAVTYHLVPNTTQGAIAHGSSTTPGGTPRLVPGPTPVTYRLVASSTQGGPPRPVSFSQMRVPVGATAQPGTLRAQTTPPVRPGTKFIQEKTPPISVVTTSASRMFRTKAPLPTTSPGSTVVRVRTATGEFLAREVRVAGPSTIRGPAPGPRFNFVRSDNVNMLPPGSSTATTGTVTTTTTSPGPPPAKKPNLVLFQDTDSILGM